VLESATLLGSAMGTLCSRDNDVLSPSLSDTPPCKHPAAASTDTNAKRGSRVGWSSGEKLTADDFDMVRVIGQGSSAKVMQVRNKSTQQVFAMKVLKKKRLLEDDKTHHTMSERSVLAKMRHPFIVNLYHAFQSSDKLYYVMDYCPGGELFYHLKADGRFSKDRTRLYTAEIALGLEHMHGLGIIYRDLKPENILLDTEGHIKLADFDLCKRTKEDEKAVGSSISVGPATTFCGTPEYTAPEMILGQAKKEYGKGVDWWALGTLIFEMLEGIPPFYDTDMSKMCQRILFMKLKPGKHVLAQTPEWNLIGKFLVRDPDARLGTQPGHMDIIKQHPFFAPLDWPRVMRREITPLFRPQEKENYIDPEAMQIPVGSDDYKLPIAGHQSSVVSDHGAFCGFTYNKQSPILYGQQGEDVSPKPAGAASNLALD